MQMLTISALLATLGVVFIGACQMWSGYGQRALSLWLRLLAHTGWLLLFFGFLSQLFFYWFFGDVQRLFTGTGR